MQYDAVLIPGGGLLADGTVPPWVEARLDAAITAAGAETPIVALSAGTPHKPPPGDRQGFPIFESTAAADYLVSRGVEPLRVYVETASYDTVGNAWFARMVHTEPRGWRRLLVVISEFHMERTEVVFRWVFGLPPVDREYQLEFLATANEGLDEAAVMGRMARERVSLAGLGPVIERLRDIGAFHHWLFTEHGAYKGPRRWVAADLDDSTLRTY